MSTFVKVALAMLLTLPLGAYITGTLVASQVDMPVERAPVVVEGLPSESPTSTPSPTSRPSPTRSPTRSPGDDDREDDRDDDHSGKGHGGDDDVRVVRPTPREVDDDYLEDRADEREDRADEREDRAEDREDRADDSDDGADDD